MAEASCCYNLCRAVPWSAAACAIGSVTGVMICAHVKDEVFSTFHLFGPWVEAVPATDKITICFIATCIVNGGVVFLGFLASGRLREILFGTLFRIFDCFGKAGGVAQQTIGLLVVVALGLALWGAFALLLTLTYGILLVWFTLTVSRLVCEEPQGEAITQAQAVVDLMNQHFSDGSLLKNVNVEKICKIGENLGNRGFMMLLGCLLMVVCQAGMLVSMVFYKERIWAETIISQAKAKHKNKKKKRRKQKKDTIHHSDSDDDDIEDNPSEIELPPMFSDADMKDVRKSTPALTKEPGKSAVVDTEAKDKPLLVGADTKEEPLLDASRSFAITETQDTT